MSPQQPPMVPRHKKSSSTEPLPPPVPQHKKSDVVPPSPLPHTQNNLISSSDDDDYDDDEFDDDDTMDYNDPETFFATKPPTSVAAAIMQKRNGGSLRRGSNALQPLEYIPASEIQPALDEDDEDLYCDPEASLATKPPSFHGRGSDGEDIYTDGTVHISLYWSAYKLFTVLYVTVQFISF